MSLSDYAHWNEEAPLVWWQEEGRHSDEPDYDPCDYVADDYGDEWFEHSSPEECIEDGNFSTKDGVLWHCDCCESEIDFVVLADGSIGVKPQA